MRASKRLFSALFWACLVFYHLWGSLGLERQNLALAQEIGIEGQIMGAGIDLNLKQASNKTETLWQRLLFNYEAFCARLREFLETSLMPRAREGVGYLKTEFLYRRSIFKSELEAEIKEIKKDIPVFNN